MNLFSRWDLRIAQNTNATKPLFQEFGWVEFLCKFQGFNDQVSLAFARGLKDLKVNVGDLITEVSEKSIA